MGALGPIEEKKIRVQPQWFETNGVDVATILKASNWNMPDNQEHHIGKVESSNGNGPFEGFITRSNGYCFLRLNKSGSDARFFLKCSVLITKDVFFRVLNDECPYPPVNPPSPPAEEVCFLYAKRAAENV